MGTPVSSSALNLSTSGTGSDTSRSAANATLKLSFSELLRGQIQGGFNTRTPEISPLANSRPTSASTPTRTPPPPETSREASRTPGNSSSPASSPPRSSQESARAKNTETGQAVKRPAEAQDAAPPSQQTGSGIESSENNPGNVTPTERPLQPQLTDTAISPDLPATIAALLNGIAGEIAEDAPASDADPETPTRSIPTHTGRPRHPHPTTADSLSTRATASPDNAMQGDTESDAYAGTNQNTSAALAGQASRNPASTIAPALQATPLDKPPALDMIMNAASAASMIPREDGNVRTASSGATTNDIAILNPPRLPTQAAAVLPQFTIPAHTGQRAWAEEIGNRVMWMLGRAESRAELILTPPLLGKVEVSIHLNGDQSTAQFFASSQSAREALEQAMPRLRELLAQAGINLGEANVNTSAEERTQDGEKTHRTGAHTLDAPDGDGDAPVITGSHWTRLNNGLIDTFA